MGKMEKLERERWQGEERGCVEKEERWRKESIKEVEKAIRSEEGVRGKVEEM